MEAYLGPAHSCFACYVWQGLALEEQIVDEVPMDDFDLPLDAVVTPSKVIYKGT